MANDEQSRMLKKGVTAWNAWRDANPDNRPDLRETTLDGTELRGATLIQADLSWANLYLAKLMQNIRLSSDVANPLSRSQS